MNNEKWWKEAVGRLKTGYMLKTYASDAYASGYHNWQGETISGNMDYDVELWIVRGTKKVKEVPAKTPKEIYLWLLQNDWLVDDDTLVPELSEI